MRNFWERQRTISQESYQCYDKELVLQHFKLYLTNSTIRRDSLGRLDFKPFVRTLVKVRFGTSLGMTQTQDFLQVTLRNTRLRSKKVTIQHHKDKWSFSSFYTSSNSE